jgi:hypothetical protein
MDIHKEDGEKTETIRNNSGKRKFLDQLRKYLNILKLNMF